MCQENHIHSINCIIPPHMVDAMEMKGDESTAKLCKKMRKADNIVRKKRELLLQKSNLDAQMSEFSMTFATAVAGALAGTGGSNLYREIYDGRNRASLPGNLARSEGEQPTNDPAIDAAYDGAGDVFDLYDGAFGRNSIDDAGMPLIATVHHRRNYNNAYWNGGQMAYGDGDGAVIANMTDLSIVGHEMSHGVVQYAGGLVYNSQSGALNESFADCFGVMVVQMKRDQSVCEADWLIGYDVWAPGIDGDALRSLKAPGTAYDDPRIGKDIQPYHMHNYNYTTRDNGGVHINSGIPNHAFYLFCQYMGGHSWDVPGKIWYRSMLELNNPNATFIDWVNKTMSIASQLYGFQSKEERMLNQAWKMVGF